VDDMTSGRVLLVDSTDIAAATVGARAARASGIVTIADAERPDDGIESLLREIDVIIAAEAFPGAYTGRSAAGDGLQQIVDEFKPALAVVTLGAGGSLAICQGREVRTPAFRVPVIDTTGAGDAFRGGFAAGLLEFGLDSVERLLEYANAVAACNCRALGAQTGLPTKADVQALVTGGGRAWSN
jgi:sugar/nucleoside kinase (ribokinase family)